MMFASVRTLEGKLVGEKTSSATLGAPTTKNPQ